MFELKKLDEPGLNNVKLALVDERRSVDFRFLSGIFMEPSTAFIMRWGDRVIPLDARKYSPGDDDDTDANVVVEVTQLGASMMSSSYGLGDYKFASRSEAIEAGLIAAEALLLFGGAYTGFDEKNGLRAVKVGERYYLKSDFVYC